MTCVQTCSNDETNATTGLVGFFYPKTIYNMLGFYVKTPTKCTKPFTALNGKWTEMENA